METSEPRAAPHRRVRKPHSRETLPIWLDEVAIEGITKALYAELKPLGIHATG